MCVKTLEDKSTEKAVSMTKSANSQYEPRCTKQQSDNHPYLYYTIDSNNA